MLSTVPRHALVKNTVSKHSELGLELYLLMLLQKLCQVALKLHRVIKHLLDLHILKFVHHC